MRGKEKEQLLDMIGNVDERYIQEYLDAQEEGAGTRRRKMGFALIPAAAILLLFGMVGFAAVLPAVGHFLADFRAEQQAVMENFDAIEEKYAVSIGDTQECDGVTGTLNSAVVEDHQLLLSYTFDWSGLEEARDGSFHTYFLPWFFYITEGDRVICQSEYTNGLHTQTYAGDTGGDFEATHIYCIDLEDVDGRELVGKELTVQLLYSQGGEGFESTFTPQACYTGRSWKIGRAYEFDGHRIFLDRVQESALYVRLFIDCRDIGHSGDAYQFVLSDELGNHYTAYPYGNYDTDGYWFVKPRDMGTKLALKVIRRGVESDSAGEDMDDSYEVLYEIPVELKESFWERISGGF